jgi:hypothetical protein
MNDVYTISITKISQLRREKYPKALFFHCAAHRKNLIVNDVNDLAEVRNTAGTVKDRAASYRESSLRRNMIPTVH